MCCRYYMEESPELRPIVEAMNRSPLVNAFRKYTAVQTRGEIRPTQVAPVIASNKSGRQAVFPMRWGFSGKPLLINARAETAGQKPAFRDSWAAHRCVIPASWYYEWEHRTDNEGRKSTGDRFLLQAKDSPVTWLCGLYRIEEGLPHFVVLTRDAGEGIRFVHDRMPLILPESLIPEWIRPGAKPEDLVSAALTDLYCERSVG